MMNRGKNATVITFNFGALARLRCVSPTNAGKIKPANSAISQEMQKKRRGNLLSLSQASQKAYNL
jgi:hypothetical protein